jgi:hypothetical protein
MVFDSLADAMDQADHFNRYGSYDEREEENPIAENVKPAWACL